MSKRLYPWCMEYLGNDRYQCSKNKFPVIEVLQKNLPIKCGVCPLAKELDTQHKKELEIQSKQEEYQLPGLLQLAKNFGTALKEHVLDGFKRVTLEEYNARLMICNNCERLDKERGRCIHPNCGCFVAIKARWKSENCPEKKWPTLIKNGQLTQELPKN